MENGLNYTLSPHWPVIHCPSLGKVIDGVGRVCVSPTLCTPRILITFTPSFYALVPTSPAYSGSSWTDALVNNSGSITDVRRDGGRETRRRRWRQGRSDGLEALLSFWATSNQRVCPPWAADGLDEDSLTATVIDQYLKDSLHPHPPHREQTTGFGTVVCTCFPAAQFLYQLLTFSIKVGFESNLSLTLPPPPLLLIVSPPGGWGYAIN